MAFDLRTGGKACVNHTYVFTCLWDSLQDDIMIKKKHIKPLKPYIYPNKVYNSRYVVKFCTKYDAKVNFFVIGFHHKGCITPISY